MNVPHYTPTDPLKGDDEVAAVTRIVEGSPRDYALFVMGTNTAFRASDILSLNCGDVRHLKVSGLLRIKEKKTSKYRTVTVMVMHDDEIATEVINILDAVVSALSH